MSNDLEQWISNLSTIKANKHSVKSNNYDLLADTADNPVLVGSKLTGSGASTALQADNVFTGFRSSGDTSSAQQALANNPATGCAMILSLAQAASGFNPADPAQSGNLNGFLAYENQLMLCPIFNTELNDTVNIAWTSDWGTIVNNITSYFQGIADADLNNIRNSLWSIAQAAASTANTNETENLFVQNAINTDNQLKVYIYKSFVTMCYSVSQGSGKNAPTYRSDTASFLLYRCVLNFHLADWPAYAPVIMGKTDASLNSWLNDNTTPRGIVPVNWTC